MRSQNSLVEVLFAQEANKELSRVRVATQLCGVGAEAITIIGVGWRSKLTCKCSTRVSWGRHAWSFLHQQLDSHAAAQYAMDALISEQQRSVLHW